MASSHGGLIHNTLVANAEQRKATSLPTSKARAKSCTKEKETSICVNVKIIPVMR